MDRADSDGGGLGGNSAGRLKGSARGALIGLLFGTGWMYWAVMNSGHPAPVWFLVVTVPAIALTGWAILRIRMFRHLVPSAADIRHWRAFRALFWAATVSEWGLVCIAAILLSHARRLDLIPQAAGVIVGLHFFPLAIVFRVPRYNWLAGIMILGAVGSLLLPLGDLRNFTGCAFSGLCLWVSSAIALSRLPSLSRDSVAATN
jgi:hypothetical protein